MKLFSSLSAGLLFSVATVSFGNEIFELNKISHFQCVGTNDDRAYSLTADRVKGKVFDIRLNEVKGHRSSKTVFKMKAKYEAQPVYSYQHEWYDLDKSYVPEGSPNLANRFYIDQTVAFNQLNGRITIVSADNFEYNFSVEMSCIALDSVN